MAWLSDQLRRRRFEAAALPHLDAAYALARWLTRNEADAADVVQDAYLRAYRYFDSYRGGDAKAWLLQIVRRTCWSWIERNRSAALVPLDEQSAGPGCAETDGALAGMTETTEIRSDLRRLDRLIEGLPAVLREVVILRELQECSYRDIADITGAPIGTVMSRLHRARAELRRRWDEKDRADAV